VRRWICRVSGHRWVERKPHRMFDLNTSDCTRCGAVIIK